MFDFSLWLLHVYVHIYDLIITYLLMAFKDQKISGSLLILPWVWHPIMHEYDISRLQFCQLMLYEYTACMCFIPCHVINEFVLLET